MHKRILSQAAVFAVLASGVSVLPAGAEPSGRPEVPRTVTLITGDKVTVTKKGNTWDARIEPAKRMGERVGFVKSVSAAGVTVIPSSVIPEIQSGKLDRALFDVTRLIELGYDDAHTSDIPLLVESPRPQALGTVTRNVPLARMSAVTTPKSQATDALAKSGKIWLNGKLFPALDVSVPQVGAPAAWQAGHTGAGTRVAVLDTGYDAKHPDLAGIVKGEKDFTGEGSTDVIGHGTHVVSTVAGRGGRYTGVAKGADLLIGKVCGTGGCPFDAILEGMQWAADSGAEVVNMSLGGDPSDGTDPVETALNRISAEKGILFVVAAGNHGPGLKVSSPAAADAALAVASVSKQDTYSEFSQTGPRLNDYAVKPDISAPGEDIVAARAEGTLANNAVGEHHARISGTSMASPHVAGAAAILAAQHPDWTGQQIKAALMGSAQPIDATIYQQGAGRLDITKAVQQKVIPSAGSLSLGFVKWPYTQPVASKQITYNNTGATPVSLKLTTDVPAFVLSTGEITVPAGGEASVTVMFDHAKAPVGVYGGRLVAQGSDVTVQTPVGAYKEPESYDLTTKFIDRDGKETQGGAGKASLVSLETGIDNPDMMMNNSTVRLPAGRYALIGSVTTPIPGHYLPSSTSLAEPTIDLRGNTVVTLDARRGKKVSVRTDEPDARLVSGTAGLSVDIHGRSVGYFSLASEEDYAVPVAGNHPHFTYFDRLKLERPAVRLTVEQPESFEIPVEWVSNTSPLPVGTRSLSAVDVGRATPEEIAAHDLKGKLAVFTTAGEDYDDKVTALAEAGAVAALFHFAEGPIVPIRPQSAIPVAATVRPEGARLAKLGSASVTLTGLPTSPYAYELAFPSYGTIPVNLDYQARSRDVATVQTVYRGDGVGSLTAQAIDGSRVLEGWMETRQVPLPLARTEYYSPMTWQTSLTPAAGPRTQLFGVRTLRAGEKATADWNKAVFGPGITGPATQYGPSPALVSRTGDTIEATLPLFSDSAGHSGFPLPEDTGDTVLSSGGKEIGRSAIPGHGTFAVPAGAADYRLTSEVTRTLTSAKVSAEWTFHSEHSTTTIPLPLLAIGFDPKLDMANHAPAGALFSVPVRVDRQPGTQGKAEPRKVEASFDDGKTWQPLPLLRVGESWWTIVKNPSSGFVSLRANASDTSGNTVAQTIIRAYRVK
ncbi:S8 family serine peptidase [Kibdelosporangium aridum]|uniref:Serine protease, subtilisin family n=1 Tax=Kibdelosporangium aridum TaxID=2030 RepID=A0A1Y5XD84_KIBAR|nr:S8 family serine peptidase [Kibdelosporangium aridum]SMC85326.1 Serine protease, subtilisin family [Kibdelosporangium aridum]